MNFRDFFYQVGKFAAGCMVAAGIALGVVWILSEEHGAKLLLAITAVIFGLMVAIFTVGLLVEAHYEREPPKKDKVNGP